MNVPLWIAVPVVATTVLAAEADVQTRRIPNLLTGPALLLGLIAHGIMGGGHGLSDALLGALIAGGILMPGWLMGWMGAGDVKLMAAIGAWFGFPQGLFVALAALMAGGVIALMVAARRGVLMRSLWGAAMLGSWAMNAGPKIAPPPVTTGIRFPFAIAVLAGSIIGLWVRT
jgi:prepilin peptidase CpaA